MQAIQGPVHRILLIWVGRVGDILVTTPFFAALKTRFPGATIRLVTGKKGIQAARLCHDLDETLVLGPFYRPIANLRLIWSLTAWPADLLIDCNSAFSRASWALALLARARVKLAFAKGRGDGIYTDLLAAAGETEHMLDRYGRLAAALGARYEPRPRIRLEEEDAAEAEKLLKRGKPLLIGIHPGNFKKFDNRWPEEKFIELTHHLQARADILPVYLAGPGEESQVRAIVSRLKAPVPILGPLHLRAFAAIIQRLDLLIANVTGTAHLAVAVGTPTLTLRSRYTDTIWMPRPQDKAGEHSGVVSGSWKSCRDIPVSAAAKALDDALERLARAGGLRASGR